MPRHTPTRQENPFLGILFGLAIVAVLVFVVVLIYLVAVA